MRPAAKRRSPWEGSLSHMYLLIEAAVDRAPANLHEPLGGDEHLVDPFPWKKSRQTQQGNKDCLLPLARALKLPPNSLGHSRVWSHLCTRMW